MSQTPEPVEARALKAISSLRHGFFTRHGGVSEGLYATLNCALRSKDDPANVRENRLRVAHAVGVEPDHFVSGYQVHGCAVATVYRPWNLASRPEVDALVTAKKGIALGVTIADCAPLLFADEEAGVIGIAHAGWKGALAGIAEATVEAMENLGAERARVVAAVGPCIGPESYEVGPEFRTRFLDRDPGNARFFRDGTRDDHPLFDLPGYVEARLKALKLAVVEVLGLDTCRDVADFFSYRRACLNEEPVFGHNIAAIALQG
jgi:purine-nucleoside/S-methyl-5'-thioadenosine phosphorylase / adenosine deaminase